jgi:ATP-dependent RNA helicase HelY
MECDRGDFTEYFELRVAIADREKSMARHSVAQRRAAALTALEKLKIGDVIRVPSGKHAGLAIVLEPGVGGFAEPRPLVLTEDRWAGRISVTDVSVAIEALGRVRVPKHFNQRSPAERRDLASSLRSAQIQGDVRRPGRARRAAADDRELERLRHEMRKHPCHSCPDREEHARWAERRYRLTRDTEALRAKVSTRTGSLARMFDQVCAMLTERGYLDAGGVTDAGRMLARVWTESDLLVTECIRLGVWSSLQPAELAAVVSTVLFEARREGEERASVPYGTVSETIDETQRLWESIASDEAKHGLELTREPDLGFAWPIYRWARGEPLSKVLASANTMDGEMPAGDFVRWARQVIDLLGQIADASPELRGVARQASQLINRGILDYANIG